MRILLALPRPLFPPDTGGKIRSLNIFSRLAKRVEIHTVSFMDPATDTAALPEMTATFASHTAVPWREAKRPSVRFYAEILANQCNPLPYFLAKCDRRQFRTAVAKLVRQHRFDLLLCDFLHTAVALLNLDFRPKVVFEHNVESLLRRRKWELEPHPLRRIVLGSEWRKTRIAEARVCRSFDHVFVVSEDDRRTFNQEFVNDNMSTIPTGVDTGFFCPVDDHPQPGRLVFVGSMDWAPNEDGVLWFLREVYPQIRRAIPNASFSIVGRNPSSRLRAIAAREPAVEVTGTVPDVRKHLGAAEVVVVPLRIGGGTRLKIPEAMAMAKAVVTTPIGCEGLPFRDQREICIAEQPEEFARAVIELLKSPALRYGIGRTAREVVIRNHSWDTVVSKMEEALERLTRSRLWVGAA